MVQITDEEMINIDANFWENIVMKKQDLMGFISLWNAGS